MGGMSPDQSRLEQHGFGSDVLFQTVEEEPLLMARSVLHDQSSCCAGLVGTQRDQRQ